MSQIDLTVSGVGPRYIMTQETFDDLVAWSEAYQAEGHDED